MKITLIIICVAIVTSCSNQSNDEMQDDPNLVGTWKLVETLMDPGDGSGSYQPVDQEEFITFSDRGIFESSSNFCPGASGSGSGTYDLVSGKLIPKDCKQNFSYRFEIKGENLYLYPPCIEACGQKYIKSDGRTLLNE